MKVLAKRMLLGALLTLLAVLLLAAWQVDDWSRDLTTNSAATSEQATDPQLRPVVASASLDEIEAAIGQFAAQRPRWTQVEADRSDGALTLRLERSTRWLSFVDDVRVDVQPRGELWQIDVASQSRVGKGDLGQNPRNIRELTRALRRQLPLVDGPASARSD